MAIPLNASNPADEVITFTCPNGHRYESAAYRSEDDGRIYLVDEDKGDVCPVCNEVGTDR
jgi:hypothetical protein